MLTIFSTCKQFIKPWDTMQENAIRSWAKMSPRPEIILMGDEDGTAEIARKCGCIHVPQIARNQYGTPILNSLFDLAQQHASYGYLCYINADIILMQDFMDSLAIVSGILEQFLMIGQRWDVSITDHLQWGPAWQEHLRARALHGERHASCGIDYFAFCPGLYDDLLPYALGRYFWDNGLVLHALQRVPVIDASQDIMAIHQYHQHYNRGSAEEAANYKLYQAVASCGLLGQTTESTHTLVNGVLKERK